MNRTVRLLKEQIPLPSKEQFSKWVEFEEGPQVLRADLSLDDFVVYAGVADVFMHAILVPNAALAPPDFEDLLKWNFNPYHSGWGLCYSFSPGAVWVEPPLHSCASRTMAAGEQLLFMRDFEGMSRTLLKFGGGSSDDYAI